MTKKNTNWSAEVSSKSNALDLEPGVFTWTDPKKKDQEQFFIKVKQHENVFNALGVNYSKTGMPQ